MDVSIMFLTMIDCIALMQCTLDLEAEPQSSPRHIHKALKFSCKMLNFLSYDNVERDLIIVVIFQSIVLVYIVWSVCAIGRLTICPSTAQDTL